MLSLELCNYFIQAAMFRNKMLSDSMVAFNAANIN